MSSIELSQTDECDEDLIDVVRIKLWNCGAATAILTDFRSADRVLATWTCNPERRPVDFEITFFDGYVMRGSYELTLKKRGKRSFSSHLKYLLRPPATQLAGAMPACDLHRYAAPI